MTDQQTGNLLWRQSEASSTAEREKIVAYIEVAKREARKLGCRFVVNPEWLAAMERRRAALNPKD